MRSARHLGNGGAHWHVQAPVVIQTVVIQTVVMESSVTPAARRAASRRFCGSIV